MKDMPTLLHQDVTSTSLAIELQAQERVVWQKTHRDEIWGLLIRTMYKKALSSVCCERFDDLNSHTPQHQHGQEVARRI
jgi:hypothetical protein